MDLLEPAGDQNYTPATQLEFRSELVSSAILDYTIIISHSTART